MNLQLGQIVEATRNTAVCRVGERGVVYEIYDRDMWFADSKGRPGVSVIFETGRHDGFSPNEQDLMLKALDLFDNTSRSYPFLNVVKLSQDYTRGHFNFHPEAPR